MTGTLSQLCAGLSARLPSADPEITGVGLDSRRIRPGDLYVALPGQHRHGAEFAAQAATAGAVAILTDAAGAALARETGLPVAQVADPRPAMAAVSARAYGQPARRMVTFGVTGTNGKSTTVLLTAAGLAATGRLVASVGTLGFRLGDRLLPMPTTTVTTPESPDLQALLARFVAEGAQAMAMEVSSHALALHRVSGICFDVVGFTNLGRDHLDFHRTEEAYFAAKAELFTPGYARRAVLNSDDPAGRWLLARAAEQGLPAVGVGFGPPAQYRILGWRPLRTGSAFDLATPDGEYRVEIAMPGEYNVRNAATALAMLDQADVAIEAALPALADAVIPGRMEPVLLIGADAPRVYVDFAHTPQAVASALAALDTEALTGRVVAVVGAGGDRDPEKRAPIGAAAASGADMVVVTDDNPRTEEPARIRAAVMAGARRVVAEAPPDSRMGRVEVIDGGDRDAAIGIALELAGADDVVAILGKGHEKTQQLADRVIDFDDVREAQRQWQRIRATRQQ